MFLSNHYFIKKYDLQINLLSTKCKQLIYFNYKIFILCLLHSNIGELTVIDSKIKYLQSNEYWKIFLNTI